MTDLRHAGGPSVVGHLAHGAGGAHHHRLVELHQVLAHQLRDVVAGDLQMIITIIIIITLTITCCPSPGPASRRAALPPGIRPRPAPPTPARSLPRTAAAANTALLAEYLETFKNI